MRFSYPDIVAIFWLVFVAYWGLSAIGIKRDVFRPGRRWNFWFRLAAILAMLAAIHFLGTRFFTEWGFSGPWFSSNAFGVLGVLLCLLGFALAFWARWNLGKNWSGVPALKKDHELVVSGPYHWVRHPIYTGILVALLGSALAAGFAFLLLFFVLAAVFVRRVGIEERLMLQQFPAQYPGYRSRTWALMPLIF